MNIEGGLIINSRGDGARQFINSIARATGRIMK